MSLQEVAHEVDPWIASAWSVGGGGDQVGHVGDEMVKPVGDFLGSRPDGGARGNFCGGHFPSDEAVFKLLYLALTNLEKKWERSIRDCNKVLGQFSVFFKDRIPA